MAFSSGMDSTQSGVIPSGSEVIKVSSALTAHILIIDDDPDQLRQLIAALREVPYRVSVALKGDQGYARAIALLPDLILLDVRMPGYDGIAIARMLKSNPATEHMPILFLSALTSPEARLAGLTAGAVDYITKPFYVDEMLERIRIHLALSKRQAAPAPEEPADSGPHSTAPPVPVVPVNAMLERLAKEFILQHLNDPALRGAGVAAILQIPAQRMNAIFEKSNGLTITEFIRQERMRRAALMLAQSTLSVAEIATEVGYENSANFSTVFRKYWGQSPMQMRKAPRLPEDTPAPSDANKHD